MRIRRGKKQRGETGQGEKEGTGKKRSGRTEEKAKKKEDCDLERNKKRRCRKKKGDV